MATQPVVTDEWVKGEFTVRREQNRGHGVPWYRVVSKGADTPKVTFRIRAGDLVDLVEVLNDAADFAEDEGDV